MDINQILFLIQTYGYLIIFPLMVLEGPIVAYVASFFASLGFFDIRILIILSVFGNFIPDLFLFSIGRFGHKKFLVKRYIKNKGIGVLKNYIERHPIKSIAIIKLFPPLPAPGLIFTGTTKMPFKKYALIVLFVGIPYSLFFTLMGYYSGIGIILVSEYLKYWEIIPIFMFLIYILLWIGFKKFVNYFTKKEKKYLKNIGE